MSRFDVHTELKLGGAWTDVTSDVYLRQDVELSRGRADESARVDPATARVQFNNRHGKYSPRNPLSPLFGLIGRNTPLRQLIGVPSSGDATFTDGADLDQDAPSVDSRGEAALLVCGWIERGAASSSPLQYTAPASMTDPVETEGNFSVMMTAVEALSASGPTGVRTATFSTTNNMSGYAACSVAVPGDGAAPVVEERLADEFNNAVIELRTGADTQAGWWLLAIQAWSSDTLDTMQLLPGGTAGRWSLVADSAAPDDLHPRVKAWLRRVDVAGAQAVTFNTDATMGPNNHARVYVLSGVAFSSIRFTGEVSAWPPRWDVSDTDVYVPVEAAGILRRLGQGSKPLRSAIYREQVRAPRPPVAYWPCEDAKDATRVASAVQRQPPMTVTGAPEFASFDGFVASDPIPVMKTGVFAASVTAYDPTGETQVQWLINVSSDSPPPDNATILRVETNTSLRWEVLYHAGGGLSARAIEVTEDATTEVANTGIFSFGIDDSLIRISLEMNQSGGDIDFTLATIEAGATSGSAVNDTLVGRTMGRVTRVTFNPNGNLGDVALGHLSVGDRIFTIFLLAQALKGWQDEAAGQRIRRLCTEEGIPFSAFGDLDDTPAMGSQRSATLLELLGQAADVDGGILHETRDDLGLAYRTRSSLYNQGQP